MPKLPGEPLSDYPDIQQRIAADVVIAGGGYDGYGSYGDYGGYRGGYGGWGNYGPIGGTMAVGSFPQAAASPQRQVVLGSAGIWAPEDGFVLSQDIDDALVALGPHLYDLMLEDDCVRSSVEALKLGIIGDGLQAIPAILPEPGVDLGADAEGDHVADVRLARQIADECQRLTDRLPGFHDTLEELLEGCVYGTALGEKAWTRVKDGVDFGKVVLESLVVKPRQAWAFVVDPYLAVRAVWAWTADGAQVVDRSKFVVFTWAPRRGDPRGTSILRAAYVPWNFKQQRHPQRAKYLSLFATPIVVVKYAPDGGLPQFPRGPGGQPDYSQRALPAHEQATMVGANIHGAGFAAVPSDWDLSLLTPNSDQGAFDSANDSDDRSIARCILLAARSTIEAKNGSRADSESSQDVTDMRFGRGQVALASTVVRDVYKDYVRRNYRTQDIVDRLTPRAGFGRKQDNGTPQLIGAWTGAGYKITPKQQAALDEKFGVPVRSAAEVAQGQQRRAALPGAGLKAVVLGGARPGSTGPQEVAGDPVAFGIGGFLKRKLGGSKKAGRSDHVAAEHGAELTGGRWVTIRGHAAYIGADGSVKAGRGIGNRTRQARTSPWCATTSRIMTS